MMGERSLILVLWLALAALPIAQADTFVHRKTGKTVTGRYLGSVFADGRQVFYVKTDDGRRGVLPQDEWERKVSEAKPGPTPSGQRGPGKTKEPSNVLEVDFGLGSGKGKAGPQVMQVVATGVGADPEKAKQNAFSNAIEQAVGVLVDAETLVRNEQIVSEKVLTFSRGYVQEYKVLRSWESSDLHYARIRATVALSKLVERLQGQRIAVRQVPGELLTRQAVQDTAAERSAAAIFRSATEDFAMHKFLKVEIPEKPEIASRDETHAKLRIRARLSPDMDSWVKFRQNLMSVLPRIAPKHVVWTAARNAPKPDHWYDLCHTWEDPTFLRRLQGEGSLLAVLKSTNPGWTQTRWDTFRIPPEVTAAVLDLQERQFRVRVVLLGPDDAVLAEARGQNMSGYPVRARIPGPNQCHVMAPFLCNTFACGPMELASWACLRYCVSFPVEFQIDMELAKLRNVVKVAASIEEVKPK